MFWKSLFQVFSGLDRIHKLMLYSEDEFIKGQVTPFPEYLNSEANFWSVQHSRRHPTGKYSHHEGLIGISL
jgi:hypothetical protein